MRIRIEGAGLPGRSCGASTGMLTRHPNVHVAVPRRNQPNELLGRTPGDAPSVTWVLDCVASADGTDIRGPYIQGPPGGRFIYLSWGDVGDTGEFTMFRRAKLWLDAIPPGMLAQAGPDGEVVGRLALADSKGNPLCATVRPPLIEWSAGPAT